MLLTAIFGDVGVGENVRSRVADGGSQLIEMKSVSNWLRYWS